MSDLLTRGEVAGEQLYRWHWRKRLPKRHGQLYRLLIRGRTMNSCLIEFVDDGWRVVTSRNALRKAPPMLDRLPDWPEAMGAKL